MACGCDHVNFNVTENVLDMLADAILTMPQDPTYPMSTYSNLPAFLPPEVRFRAESATIVGYGYSCL